MTTLGQHERKAVTYGELLREARKAGNKTMGDLARHLGVSVTKISDVELNSCSPFERDRTAAAAEFIGCDAEPLHLAAKAHWGALLRPLLTDTPAVPVPSAGRVVLYAIGQDRAGNIVWRPATVTSVNADRKGTPNLRVMLEPGDGPTYLTALHESAHDTATIFRGRVEHATTRAAHGHEIGTWMWPPRV